MIVSLLKALAYVFASAIILGVLLLFVFFLAMAAFGIAALRSDFFALAPTLYLLAIPPFAALLFHLRSVRNKRSEP